MHQHPLTFLGHDISAKEKVPDCDDWAWKGLFRGLLWRLKLGVLPSLSPCIEELRRAAADGRRKYAELRRRFLVDPHAMEGSQKSHPLNMDNPLSQDPDSVWSRHFQISELEETIDNDLTRLYPEHGAFFQSTFCQVMLRRILLVWSLMHPSCSYRQGMHELLAPLLYVLHCDVIYLSEAKQRYEDVFDDRFEEPFCLELRTHEDGGKQRSKGLIYSKTITTLEDSRSLVDIGSLERIAGKKKCASLQADEWNYGLRILVMGNDTYGAEGELGVLFSGRFVEHDAFFMFNALMCGKSGGVNMADYYLPPNSTGVSPALEASTFLYKVLAIVDLPLHSHVKGLGVEPQFFALRWIRVLFGREFDLQTLLILWDAILLMADFYDANTSNEDLIGCLNSPRRVFIIAFALSMLVYLRLILFAAPNATTCLQKLLNFPQTSSIEVLIEGARNLYPLVKETARCNCAKGVQNMDAHKTGMLRKSSSKSLFQADITKFSSEFSQKSFPDFYWEEKWKNFVLRKDAQLHCEKKQATLTRDVNRETRAVKGSSEELPFAMPGNDGSSSMQGASQDDRTTPQYAGNSKDILPIACGAAQYQKGREEIQQTMFLVTDNSNQGDLESSKLEIIDDPNAVTATPTHVSSLPIKLNTSYDYESTERNVPKMHGFHQKLGCIEGKDSLPECLWTDKGPERLSPTSHVAQDDAVPSSALLSKVPLHPRKYWMWSFGKTRGQGKGVDKMVPSHLETSKEPSKVAVVNANVSAEHTSLLVGEEKPISSRERKLIDNHANEPYSSVMSGEKVQVMVDHSYEAGETDTNASITNFLEEASHLTYLGSLGQCMSDKIQVIEAALAQILSSKIEMGFSDENSELCNKLAIRSTEANSSELVPKTVQAAIEELKNISNKLLQM